MEIRTLVILVVISTFGTGNYHVNYSGFRILSTYHTRISVLCQIDYTFFDQNSGENIVEFNSRKMFLKLNSVSSYVQ